MGTENPCKASSVKLPGLERAKVVPWSLERVQAVIDALPERYRALGVIAAGCGLRQGEGFGLRVCDIDFLRRQVHVEQQVRLVGTRLELAPPKRKKTRTVPLPDSVAVELAEHLRRYPAEGTDLVFRTREGNPITRHFYASVLIDAGESVRAVADYLGHSDPGFTLRVYAHLFPSSDDRARKAVDRLFQGDDTGSIAAP